MYVGAYRWGFLVLDESEDEHEQLILDPGTTARIVAFNTSADGALARPPSAIRVALTEHEALEEANERYPIHSLPVMPSGWNHVRGPVDGGMMLLPVPLPRAASEPTTDGTWASQRGDCTISCLAYCGYGHPFVDLDGAFVVR